MNKNYQLEFLDVWLMLLKVNKQIKGITNPSAQIKEISNNLSKFIEGYQHVAVKRAKESSEAK